MATFTLIYTKIDEGQTDRMQSDYLEVLIEVAENERGQWDGCYIDYTNTNHLAWEPSLGKEITRKTRPADYDSPEWWYGGGLWHQQPV